MDKKAKLETLGIGRIRPLPGRCLLVPESHWRKEEGGIVIPQAEQSYSGWVGRVVKATPFNEGERSTAEAIVFQRVIMTPGIGVEFDYDNVKYKLCRIEDVQAVIDKQARIEDNPVKRCRFCKSTGEANIILMNGTCSVCGKNEKGEIPAARQKSATDEEAAAFDDTYRRRIHTPKGTIMSYAGQKHFTPAKGE